ncbi:MAG TPA: MarR family transcriptional regulator [Baekduia sp.]|uniref:MarR family winged helix-turn-helix transcriptional regulator n=1 Tax=Baekduia sp. TaxID=2600305 RepID=UPI002D7893D4|nr:MarR family transcriptional regulator [Baekduia sp.]HET6508306.1 MarR family transcriptional regulator [Baekduia sp.]
MEAQAPDLVLLVAGAYSAMTERLERELAARGIAGMRPSYGFVIRAVAAEEPTVGRLAELLGVTKQSASTLVDDMLRAGFLERAPDPADRRRVRLSLSARGEAVRASALATSERLEAELAAALSVRAVPTLRRALLALIEGEGGLEAVTARRPRPPR